MSIKNCPPADSALKCFFLGPQAENAEALSGELNYILTRWFNWRRSKFPEDGQAIPDIERTSEDFLQQQRRFHQQVETVMSRFEKEIPKFSPRYIGHMFSEYSLPALLGHMITLLHNPNNISRESSHVGVEFEREAIAYLCEMLNYPSSGIGHFTSGGTIANLEFLVRAKYRWQTWLGMNWNENCSLMSASHKGWMLPVTQGIGLHDFSDVAAARMIEKHYGHEFEGPVVLIPENKHYSWVKGAHYLGLGKEGLVLLPLDRYGRIDVYEFKKKIEQCRKHKRPILGVVSVCGSTELGTIDPIHEVNEHLQQLKVQDDFHVWHHVDAAYGGFFASVTGLKGNSLSAVQLQDLNAMAFSDSITLDPHKLGYVPYASGAFLCRDKENYFMDLFKAPYVQFDGDLDRGLFTIEGSRSAAGAVSTWLTGACIGFDGEGYGKIIDRTVRTCQIFEDRLADSGLPVIFLKNQKTNILCFSIGKKGDSLSAVNEKTNNILKKLEHLNHEKEAFFISKSVLSKNFEAFISRIADENELNVDCSELAVLRLTMMNPFLMSRHSKVDYVNEFISTLSHLLKP